MTVLLRSSRALPNPTLYSKWAVVGDTPTDLPRLSEIPDLPSRLEIAFDKVSLIWLKLGKELSSSSSSHLAHTPSCAANISDLGSMLAWSHLVSELAAEPETYLVVTDDPWLYRHFSTLDNVASGQPPALWWKILKGNFRGFAARAKCSLSLMLQTLKLQSQKTLFKNNETVLLVYGHPNSTPGGEDGYFSDLLVKWPTLRRVLHVDCSAKRALELQGPNDQTLSLHAWGGLFESLSLPFKKWRPSPSHMRGPFGWLVRRAAHLEGATGQAAMIAWQIMCQRRWLECTVPHSVMWPWENHSWERQFVTAARLFKTRTIGYQHSVVGRQMLNYSPRSSIDDDLQCPDQVLCTGPKTQNQLIAFGVPEARTAVAGSLRVPTIRPVKTDPNGVVYLALPFDGEIASQMMSAATSLIKKGFHFVCKEHPMTPYGFSSFPGLERTTKPFTEFENIRALIYASSSVGLEAALSGVPTIRFKCRGKVALNILPEDVELASADAFELENKLTNLGKINLQKDQFFAPVLNNIWKRILFS